MKFIACTWMILLCALPFGVAAQEGAIHFTVKNVPSREAVLGYYYGAKQYISGEEKADGSVENIPIVFDEKGKGVFYKKDLSPGMYLLVFQPGSEFVEFIYEGKTLELSFDMQDVTGTLSTASVANQAHFARSAYISTLEKRAEGADEATMEEIRKEFDLYQNKFIKDNADNLAGKIVHASMDPTVSETLTDSYAIFYDFRRRYLDRVDFREEWLIRTPFLETKLDYYIQKLTVQEPDSLVVAWDFLLKKAETNEELYKYILIKGVNLYATSKTMGHDAVYVHLVDQYYLNGKAPWIEAAQLEKMRERVDAVRHSLIGKVAKDFEMRAPNGKKSSLHRDYSGYTVLLFVRESCGQCKREEDMLLGLMETLPQGVQVVEVLLSVTEEQLKAYQQARPLPWTLAMPYGETGSACIMQYDLQNSPRIFLLDKDKKIVAKQISADQLPAVFENLGL